MIDALIIGAGPAGLMAADVLSKGGASVVIAEAMPSAGRKFLMAGKSGLNLTKQEPLPSFLDAYAPVSAVMRDIVANFGPAQVQDWAKGLGQDIFTGSTGRVFPKSMKASPLLRAWLARLDRQGAKLQCRWRWTGWDQNAVAFDTSDGRKLITPKVTVLACGGASWPRLGSDGGWAELVQGTQPFAPANMGFHVDWSDHMQRHFGTAIKGTQLHAGHQTTRGEWVISARGIEGGGVYMMSRALREGAMLTVDLCPDWPLAKLRKALARDHGKASLSNVLRKALRFDPVRIALLSEWGRPFPDDLAPLIKALPVRHAGPRPLQEAISTAGGVAFDAINADLMLHDRPGVFAAGEMLDWEAPTGGYLITGCLATGQRAGASARRYLNI